MLTLTTPPSQKRDDLTDPARPGFSSDFLGVAFPLPALSPALAADAVSFELNEAPTNVLPYQHFSVVMSSSRKLAIYSAVNIDATKQVTLPPRADDVWEFDSRIPTQLQTGSRVYEGTGFDKGHLTRRLDPVWGDTPEEAQRADFDTFHYTNCAPQAAVFNRGRKLWAGLEDYILTNADLHNLRVSVVNGPVFAANDPAVEDVAIPLSYWKVVAIKKGNCNLSATAYLLTQKLPDQEPPGAATEADAAFRFGPYLTYQTTVTEIQQLTGLDFGSAATSDPYSAQAPHHADRDFGDRLARASVTEPRTQLTDLTQIVF